MPPTPSQRLYRMGDELRRREAQPVVLSKDVIQPPSHKPVRPLKRTITIDEVFALYAQVQQANSSWMSDTENNKLKVCTLFTDPDDPRISERLDIKDMVAAATILSAQLDRVPPPPKPQFPDDDLTIRLVDGELPLPIDAPVFIQRKASIAQMKNLVDRLKRFEVWKREQDQ
jgi:hypothetical protein